MNRKRVGGTVSMYIQKGSQVGFRAFRESDIGAGWSEWFNDSEVMDFVGRGYFPNTSHMQLKFYQEVVSGSTTDVIFAVESLKGKKLIGVCGIRSINWINRTADVSVIIGEKAYWGKGIGTECFQLASDHAFLMLNLNRLVAVLGDSNKASLKSLERVGFRKFGTGRDVYFKSGAYRDGVYMDLLRREWEKRRVE